MALPYRHVSCLALLRRYWYLRARHFRDRLMPHDKDCAVTRSVLRKLEKAGFIRRYEPRMTDPTSGSAPPVYVLTLKGSCALAQDTGDVRMVLTCEASFRDWMSINHFCALSLLHMLIDDALALQKHPYVRLHALVFEHEASAAQDNDPARRYWLQMLASETPRIPWCPDSAIETEVSGYRRAVYFEYETGSDTVGRVCAKKNKAVALAGAKKLFQRHFPSARDFRVVMCCPYESWMQAARKEMKKYAGHEHWLFCVTPKLTAANFLHGELFYSTDKGPFPFVPAPGTGSGEGSGALTRGGTGAGTGGGTQ